MATRNFKNLARSETEYARVLPTASAFRGADFSSAPHCVEPYRLPEIKNMYRDYRSDEGGALETIPGFRLLDNFSSSGAGRINGIFRYDDDRGTTYIASHKGEKLYLYKESDRNTPHPALYNVQGTLADVPSRAFVYNGVFYILDGSQLRRLKKGALAYTLEPVTQNAYVPTTYKSGEQYEQRNMLTDRYRTTFLGNEGVEVPDYYKEVYGKNLQTSFVRTTSGSTEFLRNSDARVAVFEGVAGDTKYVCGEHANSEVAENSTLSDVYLYAKEGGLLLQSTPFRGYSALQNLYLYSRPAENAEEWFGVKFEEGAKIEMKNGGRVHYACTQKEFYEAFGGPSLGCRNALLALPPNIVLKHGQTIVFRDDPLEFTDGGYAFDENDGRNIMSDRIMLLTEDTDEPEYIRVFNATDESGEKRVAITAGWKVTPGRYYLHARLYSQNGATPLFRIWRIEVVEDNGEDAPLPVQDVFEYYAEPLFFNLPERTSEVVSVKDNGEDVAFGCFSDGDGNISAVGVLGTPGDNEIMIEAIAQDYRFAPTESFLRENPDYGGTSEDAINKCTLCAIYDDRIFLSGNPALPNTVFYSQRNDAGVNDPTYFGVLNYVNDGVGYEPISSMFSFSDTLCVAKKNAVYYHAGADGDDIVTRIYPSVRGNAGLGCLGACCNFLDDPVMLTKEGVWGINKETLTLERTLGRRSSTIDARLLAEKDLASAEMVEWEGYLCLFVNGRVYMADSRAPYTDSNGGMQYEWFYLSDVGVWRKSATVRSDRLYSTKTGNVFIGGQLMNGKTFYVGGYPLAYTQEELTFAADEVRSETVEIELAYYTLEYVVLDGIAYLVEPTNEYEKEGTFFAGKRPCVVDDRLYFGNDAGDIFVFNNDKRGVAVGDDVVGEREIHHSFYTFAGHRIDAGFMTARDDCDIPHLCKSTVRRSMTVRAKQMPNTAFVVRAVTERGGDYKEKFSLAPQNFANTDFGNTSFYTGGGVVTVGDEKEKRWVEKQYEFQDGGFARPFGVFSIAYRYRIAGRIRE